MMHRRQTPRKSLAARAIGTIKRQLSLAGYCLSVLLLLQACQTSSSTQLRAQAQAQGSESQAPLSQNFASNYLMARQAVLENDLPSATVFFTTSLSHDKSNPDLLRHSFLTHYQSGNIDEAAEIARTMEALNLAMPLASEPALSEAAIANDWTAVVALADILSQSDTSIVTAGVARSWAVFAQGQFAGAVAQMSQTAQLLADEVGITPVFMEVQIAYLLEAAGKLEEAKSHLDNLRYIAGYPPHIQLSIAAAYHRLGAPVIAQDIITNHLSSTFDREAIADSFDKGTNPLLAPMSVHRGLAQALLDTSWLDTEKSIRSLLLARTQLSLIIAPEFDAAHYVVAQEYYALQQDDIAEAHLARLTQDSPYYLPAQLMKISYLRQTNDAESALVLARALRVNRQDNVNLRLIESDILRAIGKCEEAVPIYKSLLESDFDGARLQRNLAICLERTATTKAQEDEAESYFLSSLALDPNDAYTLNYLGYWYADTNRNLDKAIDYIKKAVSLQPSSGFFVDSLGWVYYRLEEYDKAVELLEQAVQLEPLDAIITEHLGDAYWRVGRDFEAVYKWQLALEQSDDEILSQRLSDKLDAAASKNSDPLIYEAK